MKTIIPLLARGWHIKHVKPASGLTGYWHVDETVPFDFAGLTDSAQTTTCPFWLETSKPTRIRPVKEAAGDTAFYLEIVSIIDKQLFLALWVKYPSQESFSHRLTYELVPCLAR